MKLFLKISNLCNHNTSTIRTDRQTDGQTTCHSNTALCVASRGKTIKFVGLQLMNYEKNKFASYLQQRFAHLQCPCGRICMWKVVQWVLATGLCYRAPLFQNTNSTFFEVSCQKSRFKRRKRYPSFFSVHAVFTLLWLKLLSDTYYVITSTLFTFLPCFVRFLELRQRKVCLKLIDR